MSENHDPNMQPEVDEPKSGPVLRAKRAIAITAVFFVVQILICMVVGIGVCLYVVVSQGTSNATLLADAIKKAMLPAALAGQAIAVWVAFRMTRRVLPGPIEGGSLAPIGWRKVVASETAMAALAGCLISLVYLFVLVKISPPVEGQNCGPLAAAALTGGWQRHLWAILALFLAPPIEEFIFRGILLEGLSNSVGALAAAGMVTFAFVIVHISEMLTYWPAWVAIGLVASTTLFFRLKTRSLVPAICVHAGYNLVLVVTVYAQAG